MFRPRSPWSPCSCLLLRKSQRWNESACWSASTPRLHPGCQATCRLAGKPLFSRADMTFGEVVKVVVADNCHFPYWRARAKATFSYLNATGVWVECKLGVAMRTVAAAAAAAGGPEGAATALKPEEDRGPSWWGRGCEWMMNWDGY